MDDLTLKGADYILVMIISLQIGPQNYIFILLTVLF